MVLVSHDLLGLFDRFTPRFVKQYAQLHQIMEEAFSQYRADVLERQFPGPEHGVGMTDEAWEALLATLNDTEA